MTPKKFIPALLVPAALMFAGHASAHTPLVQSSCAVLEISLANYEGGGGNNNVTTHIVNSDGTSSVQTAAFGTTYAATIPWSQFLGHTWTVTIDANLHTGNPTQYDKTLTGTTKACQVAPTTTTIVAPTTTVAVTTTTEPAPPATDDIPLVPTTTTAVAVDVPPVPTTTTVIALAPSTSVAVEPTLPRTGISPWVELVLALGLIAGGVLIRRIIRTS